jgi:hypothetical protein
MTSNNAGTPVRSFEKHISTTLLGEIAAKERGK